MAGRSLESPAVEVRCDHCDVSFPVGTKQCMHCGNRIGGSFFGAASAAEPERDDVAVLHGAEDLDVEEAEQEPQRRLMRAGFTLFWLILAVLSAIFRACQQQ
jgi:hypothetical protein